MKRSFASSIFILTVLILGMEYYPVNAQESICGERVSTLLDQNGVGADIDPLSGATISVEQMVERVPEVKNVVVFGQDPEEEGISITVNVNSKGGIIQHDEWWDEKVCLPHYVGTPGPQSIERCPPYSNVDAGLIYYYEMVPVCHPLIETPAIRKIKGIRVWLEPSFETYQWLGWDPATPGGKASLRYMFPDKWMVGTWTEDGFVTSGTPDISWSDSYYQNWLLQQSDINFLAGDSQTIKYLWSVTLDELPSPSSGLTSLGLLGTFDAMTMANNYIPTSPVGLNYTIDYDVINRWTEKKRAIYYPVSLDPDNIDDISKTIQLVHIPLDLPGIWMIGVAVQMEKAQIVFNNRTIVESTSMEDWGTESTRWFAPIESDYYPENNSFFAYVLLSAPCNSLEQDNCWDGTW